MWLPQEARIAQGIWDLLGGLSEGTHQEWTKRAEAASSKLSELCRCLGSDPTIKSVRPHPWKTALRVPCINTQGFL